MSTASSWTDIQPHIFPEAREADPNMAYPQTYTGNMDLTFVYALSDDPYYALSIAKNKTEVDQAKQACAELEEVKTPLTKLCLYLNQPTYNLAILTPPAMYILPSHCPTNFSFRPVIRQSRSTSLTKKRSCRISQPTSTSGGNPG